MEFKIIAFVCIVCVAVPYMVEAGCKDDLMAENKSCFDSYTVYLANLGSSGVKTSQMTTFLCNEEGKAATKCLIPLIENCQELKDDNMYQMFSIIEQMGGCDVVGGGGMGGGMGGGPMPGGMDDPCSKASMECMSMDGSTEEADQDTANASTPFGNFQKEVKTICVDLKSRFECIKKHEKDCPGLEEQYKQMYSTMQAQSGGDQPFPSFDSRKQFVMNQCPKFPADFYTNACLKDNLKTEQFTDCFKNVTGGTNKMMTCDQYKSGFECVTTALKTCGEKHKTAFTATTNFYLGARFKDGCKVEMKKETSGARVFMLSLYTMFVGVILTAFV